MTTPTAAPDVAPLRPPAYAERSYVAIALVLLGLALYFHHGHHLPIPGDFGAVDRRSAQVSYNEWIFLASVVTGFYFVFGLAGRFAFSTAAFVGLGAYVSHYVTRTSDLNWSVGFLAACLVGLVLGFVFSLALAKAEHFYFAVATLGLGEVLLLVFRRAERLTGRSSAEISGVVDIEILGWVADNRRRHFYVLLVFLGLVLLIGVLISRSPVQREAIAARDNRTVADVAGLDTERVGIAMFTLGCVISTAAGSLFVHTRQLGTPETFGLDLGIGIFVALILGGLHSLWGGIIGAWFYVYVPIYLEQLEEWTQVIWGAVLIVVMVAFPDGLVGLARRAHGLIGRLTRRRTEAEP